MQSKVVLVSDDSDFFEYIIPKLALRKYDEIFRFSFDEMPLKLHLLRNAVIIANSENHEEQVLALLDMVENIPIVVFCFNDNEEFRIKAYQKGIFDCITVMTSDEELDAKIASALNISSSLEKNNIYRDMLVRNNIITPVNEVFIDYKNILERELKKIQDTSANAVLVAIAPNDKSKFLLQPNQIETIILNNVRKNDILMNYATNKYFLLLYDIDIKSAEKIWEKIKSYIPEKIYAGFASCLSKSREQVVNEVLNKLHHAINIGYEATPSAKSDVGITNFKMYRKEFNKKIEQIISPVFYHAEQKYNNTLFGMIIEQNVGDGFGNLIIKGKNANGTLKITAPGASKINIDITYQMLNQNKNGKNHFPQSKRITLEPDELEAGLVEDLLDQFIGEFKKEVNNEYA